MQTSGGQKKFSSAVRDCYGQGCIFEQDATDFPHAAHLVGKSEWTLDFLGVKAWTDQNSKDKDFDISMPHNGVRLAFWLGTLLDMGLFFFECGNDCLILEFNKEYLSAIKKGSIIPIPKQNGDNKQGKYGDKYSTLNIVEKWYSNINRLKKLGSRRSIGLKSLPKIEFLRWTKHRAHVLAQTFLGLPVEKELYDGTA